MDEQQPKRGGLGRLLWFFVILAVVVLWWYLRPDADPGASATAQAADAYMAPTDPDDILVDLRDDATPEMIAAIERDIGVKLTLPDDFAAETKLYRAHVDPAQRDAIIAQLAKRPEVEIAEPDFEVMVSPEDEMQFRAPEVPGQTAGRLGSVTRGVRDHEGFPNDPKYKFQWHLDQIGMPKAWQLAAGNAALGPALDPRL